MRHTQEEKGWFVQQTADNCNITANVISLMFKTHACIADPSPLLKRGGVTKQMILWTFKETAFQLSK